MAFAPLFVTTLIAPPDAPPFSADQPLLRTWNSRTVSSDSSVRLDPANSSLLSSPSIVSVLLRGRRPPKLNPLSGRLDEPVDVVCRAGGVRDTPGASNTNSR